MIVARQTMSDAHYRLVTNTFKVSVHTEIFNDDIKPRICLKILKPKIRREGTDEEDVIKP